MSGATTPERSRRSRVLTVGDSPALRALRAQLRAPQVHARNLFEAIGEVTVAPANEPINAVIIAADVCRGGSISGVRALRRVDPAVQLVLVSDDGDAPDRATAAAFDHCLAPPVDPDSLSELLGVEPARDSDEQDAVRHRADAPLVETSTMPTTTPEPAAETTAPPAPEPPAREVRSAEPPLVVSVSRPAAAPSPPARTPATSPDLTPLPPEALDDDEAALIDALQVPAAAPAARPALSGLGDVDLVRAVIDQPEGVRESALLLLREQTGWKDVELGPDDTPVGRAASVPVAHRGRVFGRLQSCHALNHELRPWADWLAHWLALDQHYRDYRTMAYRDELTGAWNRRFFFAFLARSIDRARHERRTLTLMVFDIDDFKRYNDDFGHAAGDEILVETVQLLRSVIRRGDRVCRIGGDEFAVVFADPEGPREPGSAHPETVELLARRFQDQICRMRFPKLGLEAPGTLSISGGLASFPWDGIDAAALLEHADQLSLQSKRMGKNVITFGPGAQSLTPLDNGP